MLNSAAGSKRLHAEAQEEDAGDLRGPFDGSPVGDGTCEGTFGAGGITCEDTTIAGNTQDTSPAKALRTDSTNTHATQSPKRTATTLQKIVGATQSSPAKAPRTDLTNTHATQSSPRTYSESAQATQSSQEPPVALQKIVGDTSFLRKSKEESQGRVKEEIPSGSIVCVVPNDKTVLSDALMAQTPAWHLGTTVPLGKGRQIHDTLKFFVPVLVPTDISKPVVVARDQLPTFLAYLSGTQGAFKIDERLLVIIHTLQSSGLSPDMATMYKPQVVKGIAKRLGALDVSVSTKVSYPQSYSAVHSHKVIPRKGKVTGDKPVRLDPDFERVGLHCSYDQSGILLFKDVNTMINKCKTEEIPAWVHPYLAKLLFPDILHVVIGSALLQKEVSDATYSELIEFTTEWALRAPETCCANPNLIGYLWKLHLITHHSRAECVLMGHLHWNIQQADPDIGLQLGRSGCSGQIETKSLLLAIRKSLPAPFDDKKKPIPDLYFSTIISRTTDTMTLSNFGALVTLAVIAKGLLQIVICGSPVGVEAWMECDASMIQEVDLRKGTPTLEPDKPIIIGHYGHMMSFKTLASIVASDATTLVLIVDYPIMLFGLDHPKWKVPVGGCASALHTMACISYNEKVKGRRNPEIKVTGFNYQHDDHLPSHYNKALEKAVDHCRIGLRAGVNYEAGHCPEFDMITEALQPQPLQNSSLASRALVSQAITFSAKLKQKHHVLVEHLKEFVEGEPWKLL